MKKTVTLSIVWGFGLLFATSACFAQRYTVTDLGTLGGTESQANGVNASGQVTGESSTISNGGPHAFLYSGGTMIDLGTLGGDYSYGNGINASGQVAGSSDIGGGTVHAFRGGYSGHSYMNDLGTLICCFSVGLGINASGDVVGYSEFREVGHAFLYSGGTMTDIGTLRPDDPSAATAINDSGQVTGWFSSGEAFLYSGGTWTDIGSLGGGASTAYGINTYGRVTGVSVTGTGAGHAFLYKDGAMTDLGACPNLPGQSVGYGINSLDQVTGVCTNGADRVAFLYTPGEGMVDLNTLIPPDSGWKLKWGAGINDAKQIVGTGKNPNGESHAFLLSPVSTKSSTTTTLATSLNPSIYGQKVTLMALVTPSGPVPPTGTVVFQWKYFTETYTIGTATLNGAGVATLSKSYLNADPYPIIAVYRGDTNNLSSTSVVVNQTVQQTTSAATLTSSVNPSTVGQAITFTAKITSPTVMPTGPVTFTLGKTTLGTAQLSGGKATFTTSALPAGSNLIKVTYNGNSNIARSSAAVTQVVQP